jgi:hypothetical protein
MYTMGGPMRRAGMARVRYVARRHADAAVGGGGGDGVLRVYLEVSRASMYDLAIIWQYPAGLY